MSFLAHKKNVFHLGALQSSHHSCGDSASVLGHFHVTIFHNELQHMKKEWRISHRRIMLLPSHWPEQVTLPDFKALRKCALPRSFEGEKKHKYQ